MIMYPSILVLIVSEHISSKPTDKKEYMKYQKAPSLFAHLITPTVLEISQGPNQRSYLLISSCHKNIYNNRKPINRERTIGKNPNLQYLTDWKDKA